MCEIFCFNSNKPKQVNECLECFYNHSDEHPDGWGLANMEQNNTMVEKEPVKASCSQHLKDILSNPVIGKIVFAHIISLHQSEINRESVKRDLNFRFLMQFCLESKRDTIIHVFGEKA